MQRVTLNIAQLSPGMKLAEPITNSAGITLMPAGIRLTPMFIIRLKKWNIESVQVLIDAPQDKQERQEQPEQPEPRSPTRAVRAATGSNALSAEQETFARSVAEEVARCFVNLKDNPLMMQLRNVAIKRLVLHGQNGMLNVMRRRRLANMEDEG